MPLPYLMRRLFESRPCRIASSMVGMVSWATQQKQALVVELVPRAKLCPRAASSCRYGQFLTNYSLCARFYRRTRLIYLCDVSRRRVCVVHVVHTPANHAIPNQPQHQRINLRHRQSPQHHLPHHQPSCLRARKYMRFSTRHHRGACPLCRLEHRRRCSYMTLHGGCYPDPSLTVLIKACGNLVPSVLQ